jgi:CRISPR-associated protein Cas1
MKRIVEIGQEGCYLKLKHKQLQIVRDDDIVSSIPIEDMAALIIDHPQTIISQACLSALVESSVMVVSSDAKHQPIGLFLPLNSHTLQSERFDTQAALSQPARKQLWRQIIRSKIRLQARMLHDLTGNDAGLRILALKVRSGDPENIEAQAARRYWTRLFPEEKFRRERTAEDQNRFLNYGYAILRALTARQLCATGLHPSLGIHHHNRYNAYCLADDLMEAYRPFVDLRVWEVVNHYGADAEMTQDLRAELLDFVQRPVLLDGEQLTLQGAVQKSSQSLAKAVQGEIKALVLPG